MCAAYFLSAKDTFQRPPATRWTGIFQNFFCFSNPGTWVLATGGAEKFSFHSLQHRVLKFAKRNGKFSSCYLLRTKIKNAKRTTKKAANLFQTYCFHWPRRWRLIFSFDRFFSGSYTAEGRGFPVHQGLSSCKHESPCVHKIP